MSMQVNKEAEFLLVLVFELLYHLQQVECLREGEPAGLVECTVQVLSEQACPVVPADDPVWVHHGHHIDDEVLPELPGFRVFSAHLLQKPLADERTVRLPRVYPGGYDNDLLIVVFNLFISDFYNGHSQPTESLQGRQTSTILQSGHKLQQPRIRIRNEISQLNRIIRSIKDIREAKCKICFNPDYCYWYMYVLEYS